MAERWIADRLPEVLGACYRAALGAEHTVINRRGEAVTVVDAPNPQAIAILLDRALGKVSQPVEAGGGTGELHAALLAAMLGAGLRREVGPLLLVDADADADVIDERREVDAVEPPPPSPYDVLRPGYHSDEPLPPPGPPPPPYDRKAPRPA